jgi:MFS family permease
MSQEHEQTLDLKAASHGAGRFKVGTLTYTRSGLITLFLYLLWGDFCFTLMETVVPGIIPLKLNAIGAPNWLLGLIVTTIPNIMNMFGNPWVSFRSDRFRSRWGRRVPFLAGATPFLVLFLIGLGFSDQISRWVEAEALERWSHYAVILAVISVFMVGFAFFNLFVNSVYYYLFNDVVPDAFLSRFVALFRVVGGGAGAFFNFFLLEYAVAYMHFIFLGAGLLYLAAFGFMCWKVKEGEYPPPPPYIDHGSGLGSALKTYGSECFSHRFYWFLFLANSSTALTWISGGYGILLYSKVMGLSLSLIGEVAGICGLLGLAALYPAGALSDRLHPLRIQLTAAIGIFVTGVLNVIFTFNCQKLDHSTLVDIWICFSAVAVPLVALATASEMPVLMKLFPQDRFGQFCSANTMIRSIVLIVAGVGCGAFLDFSKRFSPNPDDCYRFVSVWNTGAQGGAAFFLYLLYRDWRRLGGAVSFEPPISMEPIKAGIPEEAAALVIAESNFQ